MLPPDVKVTTRLLWMGALIFALIDAGFVPLLAWRIKRAGFRQLKWTLVITTAIFWGSLWKWVITNFWESVYHYVFPAWTYRLIPPFMCLLFATLALLFWWMALRLPGHVVTNFCFLGGLSGMITHIWAVFRGILDKPPMLQGSAPVAAVVIAIFEYVFYWCIILSVAWLVYSTQHWLRRLKPGPYASSLFP